MSESEIKHIHEDLVQLRRDVALIKHIISEEYELTEEAKTKLLKARKTPRSQYIKLD